VAIVIGGGNGWTALSPAETMRRPWKMKNVIAVADDNAFSRKIPGYKSYPEIFR
jgi:hypothetical protein